MNISDLRNQDSKAEHIPVLLAELMEAINPKAGAKYLDGTLGLGGHCLALMHRSGGQAEMCCLDRDEQAIEIARNRLSMYKDKVHLFHTKYSDFESALDELGWSELDGAYIDIGVSSMQIDVAERGFSFNADGPLDMRMNSTSTEKTAKEVVNRYPFDELKRIIASLGEDPQAGRIARAIVDARTRKTIETTAQLASIVEYAYPASWRSKARNHPATRTFQALRMYVNDELGELKSFLENILKYTKVGGRIAVITFHSLEDRIVKHTMRAWAQSCTCPRHIPRCICENKPKVKLLSTKPIVPTELEILRNSRSSSAKLRVAEKV